LPDEVLHGFQDHPLGRLDVPPDVPFATLGLDSLNAFSLANEIEQQFGCAINPEILTEFNTVARLARHLSGRRTPALVSGPPTGPDVVFRATDPATLQQVFALRHDAYLRNGLILPRPDGLLKDRFDQLPNTAVMVVALGTRLIATVRLCLFQPARNWLTTPALEDFREELIAHIGKGVPFIDMGKLAIGPGLPSTAILRAILFLGLAAARRSGARFLLTGARPEHVAAYEDWHFIRTSELRSVAEGITATLLAYDTQKHLRWSEEQLSSDPELARKCDAAVERLGWDA